MYVPFMVVMTATDLRASRGVDESFDDSIQPIEFWELKTDVVRGASVAKLVKEMRCTA
jgi:hypothetical protein